MSTAESIASLLPSLVPSLLAKLPGLLSVALRITSPVKESNKEIPEVLKPGVRAEIRRIISDTLQRCDMEYPAEVEESKDFQAACMDEAARRGYNMQGTNIIMKFLIPPGAEAAFLFYPHLRKRHHDLLILIGLYFAMLFYLDDAFERNYAAIAEFNDRFVTARPQRVKMLDHFATLILEMSYFYSGASANLIVSETLNFVTGTLVEHETRDVKFNAQAQGFPAYQKTLVSANTVLCVFAFPPSAPVKDYIQALPEMVIFTNNFSDVLSFYKEDLEGESCNRISHLVRSRGRSKLDVLRGLSDDASDAYERIVAILSSSPVGPKTTQEFFYGALAIHASASRYKFKELGF